MWSNPKPIMEDGERLPNVCYSSSEQNSSSEDEGIYERKITKKSTGNESGSTSGGHQDSEQSLDYNQQTRGSKRKSVLQVYSDYNNRARPNKVQRFKQEDDEEFQSLRYKGTGKRQKCHSHNAIMARQNRLKKKQYLETLENSISQLSGENKKLKCVVGSQTETVASLQGRIRYLESVLANSKEIGMLLNSVRQGTGLPIINSLKPTPGNSSPPVGFPPPQPDHIYSRTPEDVSTNYISTGEDLMTSSFLTEDPPINSILYADVPFSLTSTDVDFPLNFPDPDLDPPFQFESLDADELFSDVGICLHIAKKRVSLEFCNSCNTNALAAWDQPPA